MSSSSRLVGIAAMLTTLSLACSQASAEHLFVSPFGNDSTGTGSPTAPFRTLQGAVNAAQDDDVIQLEMGGDYGGATITNKSLTIMSTEGGGIFEPGGPGIVFNGVGGNDILTVRGLTIDQGGSANHGILFNSGRKLNVFDAFIQNGSGVANGIFVQPNDVISELNVRNTTISEFGTSGTGGGIRVAPRSGGDVDALIEDTLAINNRFGVASSAGAGSIVDAFLDNFTASGGTTAVSSNGTGSTVRVTNSAITNNGTGLHRIAPAKLISVGNNAVRANTANGAFSATEAKQ